MSFTIYGKHSKATVIIDKTDYNKLYVNVHLNTRVIPRFSKIFYLSSAPVPYNSKMNEYGNYAFPNQSIAFSKNNPNTGYASIRNNKAMFEINNPNSFYINAGTKLIPPHIYITFGNANLDDYYDDVLVFPKK